MVFPHEKLNDAIETVCSLSEARTPDESLADDAYALLKVAIVHCRKDSESIDGQSQDRIRQVLYFLVRRSTKKRAARGQICECLKILLTRPRVLCVAQKNTELLALLKSTFTSNMELLALLDGAPSIDDADDVTVDRSSKPVGVQEQLNYGLQIMRSFHWEFPRDPLGTKIDDATEGFKYLFDAITFLTTSRGRSTFGGDGSSALIGLEESWGDLLAFLISMYTCGFRSSYKSRIKFVVVNLRNLSSAFRRQAPWKSLPWGDEPMPHEEAEAEVTPLAEAKTVKEFLMKLDNDGFNFHASSADKEPEEEPVNRSTHEHLSADDCWLATADLRKQLTAARNRVKTLSKPHVYRLSALGGC